MAFSMEIAHKAVFFALYFLLFIATVVFIERLLYFLFAFPSEKKLLLKDTEGLKETEVETYYHTFVSKLTRGKGVLSFTITASPLLGLLGTVLGIMESFVTMAEKGVSDIVEVSKGIGLALEATALGIFVAVITLVYYYYLNGKVEKAKTEIKVLILKNLKSRE